MVGITNRIHSFAMQFCGMKTKKDAYECGVVVFLNWALIYNSIHQSLCNLFLAVFATLQYL